jgi:hypothetical protein
MSSTLRPRYARDKIGLRSHPKRVLSRGNLDLSVLVGHLAIEVPR